METSQSFETNPRPPKPGAWAKIKKLLAPLGVVGALLLKFKAALIPVLKFFPVLLKTGGTMFLSIWLYSMAWGWWFALGFVLLIFVHECGHLVAARRVGLKVGAPVFIPFMGALIALKDAPKNAWIEAQVGIGGPLLGTVGAVVCYGIYLATGQLMFCALAYVGFTLNLFNLAPVGFLDGGRIVTALSPWLWVVGFTLMVFLLVTHFNFLILMIVLFSLPRLFSLFRRKTEEELRYYEVTRSQRWLMAGWYFGLVVFLVAGLEWVHVQIEQ
jgi:Zn-dependent protease